LPLTALEFPIGAAIVINSINKFQFHNDKLFLEVCVNYGINC
jgi:hypothetical protein